jgi:YidC/Oxa1 family membrane protein insertase
MYQNQPTEQQLAAEKAKKEQAASVSTKKVAQETVAVNSIDTSSANADQIEKLKKSLGNFAYSATLASAKDTVTTLENELVRIKISNKGGYIVEAVLKNFEKFKKGSGKMVELIKDNNSQLNIQSFYLHSNPFYKHYNLTLYLKSLKDLKIVKSNMGRYMI